MLGPTFIQSTWDVLEVTRDRLRVVESRQKSYANKRRRHLKFDVDDWVLLKVSLMKCVKRFGKKGKLAPRYVGPFRILERVGQMACRL